MHSKPEISLTNSIPGVNIAGYVNSEFGLGEGARATIRAIEAVGVPFVINNCTFNFHQRKLDSTYKNFTEDNPYPINIIQVNVDLINTFVENVNREYFENRYNIGFWAWELQEFPEEWKERFNIFNEIWTYSNYCAEAIAMASSVPVIKVMPSMSLPQPSIGRKDLGLPQDKFIFLFIFDFCSSSERKNPAATIKAFKQTFGKSNEDVLLVIKFSNAEYFPEHLEQLKALVEDDPSVKFMDGYLLRHELNALIYNCDCYVSLHRSEGFGLTIAEAMFYGKPVIATDYSANTEYMNVGNSFPVKYDLIPIAEDFGSYKKSNLWANPDIEHAAYLMRHVFDNYEEAKQLGKKASEEVKSLLHPQVIGSKIKNRLEYVGQLTNNFTSLSRIEQMQARLTDSHTELVRSLRQTLLTQQQLQQTQIQKEQLQTQVYQTQTELERSQTSLQQTQTHVRNLDAQLQHNQIELEQSLQQASLTQSQLQHTQSQLQHTQTELEHSQSIISGMESSKFWKLRTVWFRLKQSIGLIDNSTLTSLSSAQTTELPKDVDFSEVTHIEQINFKALNKNLLSGCFDKINDSSTTIIKVSKITQITASGWAIIADESRAADRVIITYGNNNLLVADAPVNLSRPDVAKSFDNPAYSHCGWSVTFDSSTLPTGEIFFKAWAYNAKRQEAIQLNFNNSNLESSNLLSRLKYLYSVLKVKGLKYALAKLSKKIYYKLDDSRPQIETFLLTTDKDQPYYKWLNNNFPRKVDLRKMAETVDVFGYKPVISVIMPVFNTPEHFLREAIESVLNQVYPYWELCIADDASTKFYIKTILQEYAAKDSRIKIVVRTENGHIVRASNSAIKIATGEFIALLDHDDLLTPDALYEVALLLNKHSNADMIYSDEDKIDEYNQLKDPFFKPDWCPDSFLSRMYTCHLGTYRRSLVSEIGGFREGYEGSQDYDLVLRLTEKTENIFHIPKILYHWRVHPASTASSLNNKTYAIDTAKKALSEAINRRGEPGKVTFAPRATDYHVIRYNIRNYDLVSIIIPTRNLGHILDKCLVSIFEKTTYNNYEVVLLDNGSTEIETIKIIDKWKKREPNKFTSQVIDIPFNFSKLNNLGVKHAKGKYLLFLNNDTEVITPDWIEAMIEQAQRASIGAVGALLLYPDDTIQHAGVVAGVGGVAGHSHKHFQIGATGYFSQINTVNNFSAVTAACFMCKRDVFEEVGGFEEELASAFNDIDFCFKLVEKGYRNIYLPHVVLYHYESKSRGYDDTPEKLARFIKEIEYMQNRWKEIIGCDPCYSPNLTLEHEDYSIRI